MPLTIANAGALVSGGVTAKQIEEERKDMKATTPKSQPPETVMTKVLRPFYYGSKVIPRDSRQELPRLFALEMRAANKVEILAEETEVKTEVKAEVKPEIPRETKTLSLSKGDGNAK